MKYTDPTGEEVDLSDLGTTNQNLFLKEINRDSYLQFSIKDNKLILNKNITNQNGSKTFGDNLLFAVNDRTSIKIYFAENKLVDGKKERILGGFCQYFEDSATATIGINPNTAYYTDVNGELRKASACGVFIHELCGHIIPQIKKQNGNAIEIENIIRDELRLPLKKEDKTHVCF